MRKTVVDQGSVAFRTAPAALRFSTLLAEALVWQHRYNARRTRFRGPYEVAQNTQANYSATWRGAARQAALEGKPLALYIQQKKGLYARNIRVAFHWHANLEISQHLTAAKRFEVVTRGAHAALTSLIEELRALAAQTVLGKSAHIKRDLVCRWPARWREEVLLSLPRVWYLPFLVAACCGCRPVELIHGVRVRTQCIEGRPYIHFRIHGAKVTSIAGQPYRELTILGDANPLAKRLFEAIVCEGTVVGGRMDVPRECMVRITTLQPWQRALRKVAHEIPRYQGLCPIMLRHQFAADLKTAGTPRIERAQALGHVNDRSIHFYGRIGIRQKAAIPLQLLDVQVPRAMHLRPDMGRLMALRQRKGQQVAAAEKRGEVDFFLPRSSDTA